MSLISVVLTLIVVGLLLGAINKYLPMDGNIKTILNIVIVVAVILWLLYGFGVINHSAEVHMPVMK